VVAKLITHSSDQRTAGCNAAVDRKDRTRRIAGTIRREKHNEIGDLMDMGRPLERTALGLASGAPRTA
jgi:hypothetical protein